VYAHLGPGFDNARAGAGESVPARIFFKKKMCLPLMYSGERPGQQGPIPDAISIAGELQV